MIALGAGLRGALGPCPAHRAPCMSRSAAQVESSRSAAWTVGRDATRETSRQQSCKRKSFQQKRDQRTRLVLLQLFEYAGRLQRLVRVAGCLRY